MQKGEVFCGYWWVVHSIHRAPHARWIAKNAASTYYKLNVFYFFFGKKIKLISFVIAVPNTELLSNKVYIEFNPSKTNWFEAMHIFRRLG